MKCGGYHKLRDIKILEIHSVSKVQNVLMLLLCLYIVVHYIVCTLLYITTLHCCTLQSLICKMYNSKPISVKGLKTVLINTILRYYGKWFAQ